MLNAKAGWSISCGLPASKTKQSFNSVWHRGRIKRESILTTHLEVGAGQQDILLGLSLQHFSCRQDRRQEDGLLSSISPAPCADELTETCSSSSWRSLMITFCSHYEISGPEQCVIPSLSSTIDRRYINKKPCGFQWFGGVE